MSERTRDRVIIAMQGGDAAEIVDALTDHIGLVLAPAERAREGLSPADTKANVFMAAVKSIHTLKREDGEAVVRALGTFFGVTRC